MNKLIVKDTTQAAPAVVPGKNFLNLYTNGQFSTDFIGASSETLRTVRTCRSSNGKGITLCIERDANGDFSVTKVEEF